MADLLVPADAALVEAAFTRTVPSELTSLTSGAVCSAGRRVITHSAVTGVVTEVVN